jgi:hypothetical protein
MEFPTNIARVLVFSNACVDIENDSGIYLFKFKFTGSGLVGS